MWFFYLQKLNKTKLLVSDFKANRAFEFEKKIFVFRLKKSKLVLNSQNMEFYRFFLFTITFTSSSDMNFL